MILIIEFNYFSLFLYSKYIISKKKMAIRLDHQNQQSNSLQLLSNQYQAVFPKNYNKLARKLKQQLTEEIKFYEKQLAFYKKETCQQNIDKLVSQKRRQKEKQRQKLENRWRQCSESFKKLQEQQKVLNNQLKQTRFDLKSIQLKIVQFNNKKHHSGPQSFPNHMDQNDQKFLTQFDSSSLTLQNHSSQSQNLKKPQMMDTKSQFETSNLAKIDYSVKKKNLFSESTNKQRFTEKKAIENNAAACNNDKQRYLSINDSKLKQNRLIEKTQRSGQIFELLMCPRVKAKIFDILYRKI